MEVSLNIRDNEKFLSQFPVGAFLQSRFWSSFLKSQGIKNWQLNVFRKHEVVAQCLLYSINLPFGKSYLYAPKGPLIATSLLEPSEIQEAFALILTQIRDITIATEERQEVFCRLEPNITPLAIEDIQFAKTEATQPSTTALLSLDQIPEKIFDYFKEKTRYNIRLAERKNIEIFWDNGEVGMSKFLTLLPKTTNRQKIRSHQKKYYELLGEAGRKHGNIVQVCWAEKDGIVLAANIYIFFGSTATYLHGCFDYEHRKLMAPYLLQWEAIKRAYEIGLGYFDFWGLAPRDNSKPSWDGFSRFKRGFSANEVSFPGAFDFIYVPVWYNVYTRVRGAYHTIRKKV